MSNVINSLTYCCSGDVLSLVMGSLESPRDVKCARTVCKIWRNQYSVQNMIGDIEAHDKRLWTELTNITKFIKDGEIHYIDKHDGEEKSVAQILIVQSFDRRGGAVHQGSWVTPFFPGHIQCKNPLIEDETGQLKLSIWSTGLDVGQAELNRLGNEGICYQPWQMFHGVERNIVISVAQLRTAIKANKVRHGDDQDTSTSI